VVLTANWIPIRFLRRQAHTILRIVDLPLTARTVMSVFSSMRYCLGDPTEYSAIWAALGFMPFGLFFDFMDGKIARWRNKSSLMGQELDSLADLVCPPLDDSAGRASNNLVLLDLFRARSCRRSVRARYPYIPRPHLPRLLRSLRIDSPGSV
jgi:hypothetical protein